MLTDASSYADWDSGVVRVEGRIAPQEKIKVVSEANPGRAFPVKVTELSQRGATKVDLGEASIIGLVLAGDALLQQELFLAVRDAFPGQLGRRLAAYAAMPPSRATVAGIIDLGGGHRAVL